MALEVIVRRIDELQAHPKNYRKHPQDQIDMIRESLQVHGQQKPIVITGDGVILAGHGLCEAMRQEGEDTISCTVYTGDDPEAFLIIDNLTSKYADDDLEMLDSLLKDIATEKGTLWGAGFDDDLIEELLATAAGAPEDEDDDEGEDGDDGDGEDEGGEDEDGEMDKGNVPDVKFPTDNDWDIPTLDLRYQGRQVDNPAMKWGTFSRHNSRNLGGTIHFYTEDYKFDGLWKDPTPVINCGCVNAVEPNVSTHPNMANAIALYGIYQKRWVARLWQSKGVRIFVDANVELEFWDLNLLGVPKGWKAWCTRGYSQREDDLAIITDQFERCCAHAGTDDIVFWVYGGGKAVRDLAREKGWVWVQEHLQEIEKKREAYGLGKRRR
jgi:hypothetical protein